MSACTIIEMPRSILQASEIEWGVTVDAYLMDAARVGDRYVAKVYSDLSGKGSDGMTVVTPPVKVQEERGGYTLLRSTCGGDYYVVVSRLQEGKPHGA